MAKEAMTREEYMREIYNQEGGDKKVRHRVATWANANTSTKRGS